MVAVAPPPHRSFVPAQVDVADFARLESLYRDLLERPVDTVERLQRWLADFAELSAVVDEYGSRRYIDKSCHTDDKAIEQAYLHFVENVEPRIKPLYFQLQKKFLESPARTQLPLKGLNILSRKWAADVDLFRDENVPLETELTKLANEYDKIMGGMVVEFRGKEYTPQQMGRFGDDADRATRQAAWEASTNRRLVERERIEAVFDRQLPLRAKVARNAG